jgi:RNA polymerase sigma-70 factor (ECF subfamily)
MSLAVAVGMLRTIQSQTAQQPDLRIGVHATTQLLKEEVERKSAPIESCPSATAPFEGTVVDEDWDGPGRPTREQPAAITQGDLIEDLRRGSEEAFAALVRREGGRMFATARRLLGRDEDAQDAVQEAFLQAHRAIGSFAGEARLSTWLHRIVVNASLMKLRNRRRKPEQAIDDLLAHLDETGSSPQSASGWERSSEELLASAECRTIVRRAMGRLPEPYHQVLILREIQGFDTDETALMVGASANAVKVRLHRARQALRTLLGREFAENWSASSGGPCWRAT